MKNLQCRDLESVLREGGPEELAVLERHSRGCPVCAEELRCWNEISEAARALGRNWESPTLWPRIAVALAKEARLGRKRESRFFRPWLFFPQSWLAGAAALVVLMVSGWRLWEVTHRPTPTPEAERRLLAEQSVREVEKAEADYVTSIEKLSTLAEPKITNPGTPLGAAYREKLLLLDTAIADCHAMVAHNRANPQLRQALLSMYREKKQTLEALLQED